MSQSKVDSVLEIIIGTATRALVYSTANHWFLPVLGFELTHAKNAALVGFYTIISLTISFGARRLFNNRSVWGEFKFLYTRLIMGRSSNGYGLPVVKIDLPRPKVKAPKKEDRVV